MRIGLIDVDGHNFPNIPLMKISAYHKKKGDHVEWYQPLFHSMGEPFERVYMSKVFSFTPDYEYYVNAHEVVKGGSGYAIRTVNGKEYYDKSLDQNLPHEIEHIYPDYSLYPEIKDTAYGFLTRGCPRQCSFCHVSIKEGCRSRKVADLKEFWNGQKNIVVCDPNILACPEHVELLQQLADSKARIDVNQGLDIRLINDRNIEVLKKIRFKSIHIAYDRYQQKELIERKIKEFIRKTGFNKDRGRVKVYILCNYDTTLEQDVERIQFCRELKISPYPMIYNKENAAPVYRKLQRWCNDFIFWNVPEFKDYTTKGEKNEVYKK